MSLFIQLIFMSPYRVPSTLCDNRDITVNNIATFLPSRNLYSGGEKTNTKLETLVGSKFCGECRIMTE